MSNIKTSVTNMRADPIEMDRPDLVSFFKPRGVVVFGSIGGRGTLGRYKRFGCPVYLVYPKGGETDLFPVYRDLDEIEGLIDLALIRTAPATVLKIIDQCGRRGVPNALVFSSGFSEVGAEGRAYEEKLTALARHHGVRVLGPNTNENAFERFDVPDWNRGGLIGVITQSGHNGRPIVQGNVIGAHFTRWIAGGNEADLEAAHFLRFFAEDPATAAIAGYIEGFRNFPLLRDSLICANEHDKPVVILKIGSTEEGAATAVSHTGHLTGPDAVVDGLFAQHGVTRVRDLDELLETANLFAKLPPDVGSRVALYSISGGSGTLMTEVAASYGLKVPALEPETQRKLHTYIADYLTVVNPIDNGASLMSDTQQRRLEVLDLIAADPNIDVIVIGLTGAIGKGTDDFADDIFHWAKTSPKPVIGTWNSYKTDEPGFQRLVESGVPVFRSFRNCFAAMRAYSEYQEWRKTRRSRPSLAAPLAAPMLDRPGVLSGQDAAELLRSAGVPMAREELATSESQAASAAGSIGGTLAMKLVSPAFPHKSDVGLLRLGVSPEEAVTVYSELIARAVELDPKAPIDGVLIQEQLPGGVEMLVGLSYHPATGPAITIGAGGIYTEILDDVTVRPLPVDAGDIREMVTGLKVAKLLAGARGAKPANLDSFVELALRVARLGESAGGRLAELDLNPVLVTPERAVAVDVLAVAGGD